MQTAAAVGEALGFKGLSGLVSSSENLINVWSDSEMSVPSVSKQNYLYKAIGREQHLISPMAAYRFGDFSMAQSKAEALVSEKRAQHGPKSLQYAQALAVLATVMTDAGVAATNDRAAKHWRDAAALFRELRQDVSEGLALHAYGMLLADDGRTFQLKPVVDRLLSIQGGSDDVRMLALSLSARVDASEGKLGAAFAKLGTALHYWDTRITTQKATQDQLTRQVFGTFIEEDLFEFVPQLEASRVLAQAADMLAAVGQHESAVRLLEKAIEKTRGTHAHYRQERTDFFLRLAMQRVKLGQRGEASTALRTVRNMHWWNLVYYNRASAEKHYGFGRLAAASGKHTEAEVMLRASLSWWQSAIGGSAESLRPISALARFYAQTGQLQLAETYAAAGVCLADKQRGTLGLGHGSRDAEAIRDTYIAYLEVASLKAKSPSKPDVVDLAFRAMQAAAAGVAQRDIELALSRLAVNDKRIADLMSRRARLAGDLERARRGRSAEYIQQSGLLPEIQKVAQREAPTDPQSKALWLQRTQDTRRFVSATGSDGQSVEQLARELDQVNAQVATLNHGDSVGGKDIPLNEVRRSLKPDEVFLQFVVTATNTYVVAVDSNVAQFADISLSRDALVQAVGRLRQTLAGPSPGAFDTSTASELYRALLQPLGDMITSKKRLVVIKDGPLAELPFSILKQADGRWLIEAHSITTVVSPATFVVSRKKLRPSAATKPFFGIGHPVAVSRAPSRGGSIEQTLGIRLATRGGGDLADLPELPDAGVELKAFATAFGGGSDALLVREQATVRQVRGARLADYRIISFASHALLPGQHMVSDEAAIVLSPPNGASDPASALLTSSEIASLKLDADVVILSACNTASGNDALGGDRLGGLARAFFTSGARSVLVSHWAVNSVATRDLMTRFASQYRSNADKAAALRAAMLGLFNEQGGRYQHPYYWAAFDLVGS